MIDGMTGKDAELQIKTVLVFNLLQREGKKLQIGIHRIDVQHVLLDVFDCFHQRLVL